jgi:hypothetical protein
MSVSDAQYKTWLESDGSPRCILLEIGCSSGGSEVTRHVSNFGYTTHSGETPATTAYLPYLTGSFTFSRKVSVTSEEVSMQVQTGEVEIDNRDGSVDSWLTDVWVKRSIKAFIGDPSWARSDFRQILAGRVGNVQPSGRDKLKMSIYDEAQRLNYPLTEAKLGGTTDNKESLIPLTFGEVFNITPLLTNPGTHEYSVHNGAIEGILEVRDNGIPLTGTSLPTYHPTTGRFNLAASPAGQITCDVQGAKPSSYVHTLSTIVQEMCTNWGSVTNRLTSGDLDATNLSTFNSAHSQTLGIYTPDQTNVLDACNQLCRSLQASLYFSRAGKLSLWTLPTTYGSAVAEFTAGNMVAKSFQVIEVLQAKPSVKLGYGKNYTVQKSGLAGGLPSTTTDEFAKDFEDISVSDSSAVALYRYTSVPAREETLLVSTSEATAQANTRLSLRSTNRLIVSFVTFEEAYLRDLGDVVGVDHTRIGGRHVGVIISIAEDLANNRITLEVML